LHLWAAPSRSLELFAPNVVDVQSSGQFAHANATFGSGTLEQFAYRQCQHTLNDGRLEFIWLCWE
jgi:hypothetical protein